MIAQTTEPLISVTEKFSDFLQKQKKEQVISDKAIKIGIWIYFLLLIFEGALRKWVFPSLSNPLLVIRDPVAIYIIYRAWQANVMKPNIYVIPMVAIGIIGIFTSYFFGHGNIVVALFGARILMIHFPLMFVIGSVFTRDDVVKIGKVLLWISIPMVILVGYQFFSPQNAWVNKGIGDDTDGGGFSGALGYFRPPGTFSFTNGNSLFFSFVAVYVIYFWIVPEKLNKIVLIASTVGLIASIPLSISRSLFFSIIITVFFAVIASSRNPKYFSRIIGATIGILIIVGIISQTDFFQTAAAALIERFTIANTDEGGLQNVLIDRYLGGLVYALASSAGMPYFGYGLGMGTNVGALLLTGKLKFLISEGEWGRLIGELGALFGILVILIRVVFTFNIVITAYKKLSENELLPWVLLSFAILIVPQGQWGQTTSLGFSTLIGGLVLGAFNPSKI